jgi:hypothetical protein
MRSAMAVWDNQTSILQSRKRGRVLDSETARENS